MAEYFDFSRALKLMKEGTPITCKDWNGKDMFIYAVPAGNYPARTDCAKAVADENGGVAYAPYLAMYAGGVIFPWTASQKDFFSSKWMVAQDVLDEIETHGVHDEVPVPKSNGSWRPPRPSFKRPQTHGTFVGESKIKHNR